MAARAVQMCRGNNTFLSGERRGILHSRCPSSSPHLRMKPLWTRRTEAALLVTRTTKDCPSLHVNPFPHSQATHRKEEDEEESSREVVTHEKLDLWMRESIGEIVRNIGEAPFLLHMFSVKGGGVHRASSSPSSSSSSTASSVRVEREAATSAKSWSCVKKRWDRVNDMPDGVVLIQELEVEAEDDDDAQSGGNTRDEATSKSSSSRTWGLVVQGRGLDCAACYILDTCRVRSTVGFCTHFCLVRAHCFGEPVPTQLKKAWLQGS